jgi:hypothetical protein
MSGLFVNSLLSAIELIKKCVPDLSWDEIMRGNGTDSLVAIENGLFSSLIIFCMLFANQMPLQETKNFSTLLHSRQARLHPKNSKSIKFSICGFPLQEKSGAVQGPGTTRFFTAPTAKVTGFLLSG